MKASADANTATISLRITVNLNFLRELCSSVFSVIEKKKIPWYDNVEIQPRRFFITKESLKR